MLGEVTKGNNHNYWKKSPVLKEKPQTKEYLLVKGTLKTIKNNNLPVKVFAFHQIK